MAFELTTFYQEEMIEHATVFQETLATIEEPFEALVIQCTTAILAGNKILLCGNGGSAADAQHIAAELSGRFTKDRKPLAGLALTTDTSALTAIGNDYGYDHIFSRQIEAIGQAGDIVIGISTSGNSANILKAFEMAIEKKITPIGLAGKDGGKMKDFAETLLIVPSDTTARIQEMHILIGHMLCGALEQKLGLV
ncbi:MAG: D-sedoheptulose 7-phosphate isomerase [Alphaproteobacteria bacterium]